MHHVVNDASSVAAQSAAREVRLADYAPPAFLVDTVDLTFELDEAATKVTARMALRRVRPVRAVMVILRAAKPAIFRDQENSYEIAAAYGPWRTSGCWWALEAWDAEEWDVLAVRAEKFPSGAKARCLCSFYGTAKAARFQNGIYATSSSGHYLANVLLNPVLQQMKREVLF